MWSGVVERLVLPRYSKGDLQISVWFCSVGEARSGRLRGRLDVYKCFHYSGIMKDKQAVEALAALAQDSRLAVYRLLVKRGPEGFAAGEIAERLGLPGPTLSFHLKALAQAGLVITRKDSRFIYYTANFEQMNTLVGYLTENCCSLGSTCDAACAPPKAANRRKSA